MRRPGLILSLVLSLAAGAARAEAAWLPVPGGRLKAEIFASPQASVHPMLVVVLHGDAPFNKPGYQYAFAQAAAGSGDLVAAAILRPGYTDTSGDKSSGVRGLTTGDNYTPDRLDALAAAIRQLRDSRHARAVVLVGHSGGAALSADLLALHPDLAQAALLVSCPCDVPGWRAHMKATQGGAIWDRPVDSLSPLALAGRVPVGARVRMLVGAADPVAPPRFTQAYSAALKARGIDVTVSLLPGQGHEIFLDPAVQAALKAFLAELD